MPSGQRAYDQANSFNLLRLALAEQEANARPDLHREVIGRTPSALATNAYLGAIPLTGEREREQRLIDAMDERYLQDREDERSRRSKVDDVLAGDEIRRFNQRRNVVLDNGAPVAADLARPDRDPDALPGERTSLRPARGMSRSAVVTPSADQPRQIKRYTTGGGFTDPDAAMSAAQRASIDPRVLAANLNAQGRVAAAEIGAGAKAAEKKAATDAKAAEQEETAKKNRDELVELAQRIQDDPALSRFVGPVDSTIVGSALRAVDPRTYFDLGGGTRFESNLAQLRALLQLASAGKMKGQGQITENERKILKESTTALNNASTEQEFLDNLDRIITAHGGQGRATRKAVGRFEIIEHK